MWGNANPPFSVSLWLLLILTGQFDGALIFFNLGFTFALFIRFVAGRLATDGTQRCIHGLMPYPWILACAIPSLPMPYKR